MRLILHIIWKDIRAERWGLLFWATLYVAQILLGLTVFNHDQGDRDFLDAVSISNVLMVSAQFIMSYVLVVRFVQADTVAGTRMFWLTRPIHPGRLLRAKGWGVILIFGLLPAILQAPWWIYCGFTASDMGWAAFETVGWQLLVIGPAFLLASMTDDFGRALMWGLVLCVFLVAAGIFLYTRSLTAISDGNFRLSSSGGLLFTRIWLTGVLLVLGSLLVAAHQFQTRQFVRSLILAVTMVVACVVAGRAWPLNCTVLFKQINDPEPVREIATANYPGLQLITKPARIVGPSEDISYNVPKVSRTWILHAMELSGKPEGWMLGAVRFEQSWVWPNDPVPVGSPRGNLAEWSYGRLRTLLAMPPYPGDAETVRWLEAKAAEQRANGKPVATNSAMWQPDRNQADPMILFGRTQVPDSVIARIRDHAPAGEARVDLELAQPRKLFELPLKPGATWAGSSQAYRVGPWGALEDNKRGLQLMVARPAVREEGLWSVEALERTHRPGSSRDPGLLLVNRRSNTFGSLNPSGITAKTGRVIIGGVLLKWSNFNVTSSRVIRNGEWVPADPDWSEHSTMVMIEPGPIMHLTRESKVSKYELLEQPATINAQTYPPAKS